MTPDVIIQTLIGALGFLIVYTLMGIRAELRDLTSTMRHLENDLRGQLSDLDRRVTRVETNCDARHEIKRHSPHA